MSSPTPHRFDHPVWDLRDVIGWVLDRDPAQFGRIHSTEDAKSAVNVALFYTSHLRPERDPNALTTLLHELQLGRLIAHHRRLMPWKNHQNRRVSRQNHLCEYLSRVVPEPRAYLQGAAAEKKGRGA